MDEPTDPKKAARTSFLRRHPALAIAGALGVGAVGGAEMLVGLVLGVGATALLGRERPAPEASHRQRTKLSSVVAERARAIVRAVLGDVAATAAPAGTGNG